ncbi:hypothetical protein A0H81_05409 [Grifola frondosa]|uniref:Cysteine-rich protein 1 n=1 Tax=Grifola frondosa TaxID=5627 RepID=A0A1C7MDX8_GRIFR|nr:hypothetical protein A0H81_05409 [Grifola frondosa]
MRSCIKFLSPNRSWDYPDITGRSTAIGPPPGHRDNISYSKTRRAALISHSSISSTMHPFGGTPICPRCNKAVYAAEQIMGPGRKPYCKLCHVKIFGTRDLRQANLPNRDEVLDGTLSPRSPVRADTFTFAGRAPSPPSRSNNDGPPLPARRHHSGRALTPVRASFVQPVIRQEEDVSSEVEVDERPSPASPTTSTATHVGRGIGGLPRTIPLSPTSPRFVTGVPTMSMPLLPTTTGRQWGGGTPTCPKCGKAVYFAEQVKAIGKTYHKSCLRCTECNTTLDSSRLTEKDGYPFCHRCYGKLYGPQGSGYALLGKAVAAADISIAQDGSFIETSSGAAARELKRRYDQYFGVGKDVRSPYAITAFVNQHGKQMYRVGLRELSAPAASAQDAEDRSSHHTSTNLPTQTITPQMRRRSRMSVHSFLPSSVFKNATPSIPPTLVVADSNRSTPMRKLRKTRSIPSILVPDVSVGSTSQPPTGRPHAHSVSSADSFLPPTSAATDSTKAMRSDFFSGVMPWQSTSMSSLPSSSTSVSSTSLNFPASRDPATPQEIIRCPFGPGVVFDSPSWQSTSHLSSPPVLREMQSFESGLTARADHHSRPSSSSKLSVITPEDGTHQPADEARTSIHPPDIPQFGSTSLAETTLHSRYSTDIFDVLQTYRGLPALDKISSTSNQTTIRLSLRADESAAPRDDPRFVIWGDVELDDSDDISRSVTDISSGHSGVSWKRGTRDKSPSGASETPFVSMSAACSTKKMLVAATIERWIAQLTSELDYDELLVFFLTYRTYVSAVDLGHLLICRFHWALGEARTTRDEMVRRIVRVRTFTAIRYWLLTFFDVDFVPNRELRLLFAEWLNSLRRDPVLQKHKDALKIVRQLRKVVVDCKDAHIRTSKGTTRKSFDRSRSPNSQSLSLSDSIGPPAEPPKQPVNSDQESDIDIDFDFDSGESTGGPNFSVPSSSTDRSPSDSVDLVMLRQPLHLAVLQYGKQGSTALQPNNLPFLEVSPITHNTFSRVFVNTIGRLGRWKRVLNARSSSTRTPMTACLDVSAFDVEASETGDLLLVRGGVEQYLKMVESQIPHGSPQFRSSEASSPSAAELPLPLPSSTLTAASTDEQQLGPFSLDAAVAAVQSAGIVETDQTSQDSPSITTEISDAHPVPSSNGTDGSARPTSVETCSDSSSTRQLDVVSIDDLDLSDLSSDENVNLPAPPA